MAALLFGLVAAAYWRLILTGEFTWLDGHDMVNQQLPWYQMQASEWHAGHFPMWDPYLWAGQPLIGQFVPSAAFPLNWILYSLPLRDGWIQQVYLHWYLVLLHVIAAWGAYRLARELQCSRIAAVFAASVFALMGEVGGLEFPQMLGGAIWAPLILLFLLRVLRGRKTTASAVFGGFVLGFSWLSGHHQIPIYLSMAAACFWLYHLYAQRNSWRAALRDCSIFWLFVFEAGALQTLPAREFGLRSMRWVGMPDAVDWTTKVPYTVHSLYSLHPSALLGVVIPGMRVNGDLYLGLTGLLFAVLGVVLGWRRREVRVLFFTGVGGLLVALGGLSIFQGVLYALLPVMDKARSPSFAVVLFGVAAAALAGIGLDSALRYAPPAALRRASLLAAGFAMFLLLLRCVLLFRGPFEANFDGRPLITAIVGLLLAGGLTAFAAGALTRRAAAIGALVLLFVEIGMSAGYSFPSRYQKNRPGLLEGMAANADIVEFLRRQPEPFRIELEEKDIAFNFGDWHGIPQRAGYVAGISANIYGLESHSHGARRLLGVEYALRRAPDDFYQEEVFAGASGVKVYRNRTVYPRAFAVHRTELMPDRRLAPLWLNEPGRDWRTTAFLAVPAPPLETCSAQDSVQIITYQPNCVRLQAGMGCRGMVILSDTFFTGWQALVDGRPAPIYEAYTALRGVVVEAGTHIIEFRYRPRSVFIGAALSALSALAALGVWIASRRSSLS